jgi:hypothetical protein
MERRNGRHAIERAQFQLLSDMLWHVMQLPRKPKGTWRKLLYCAAAIFAAGIGIGRLIEQSL